MLYYFVRGFLLLGTRDAEKCRFSSVEVMRRRGMVMLDCLAMVFVKRSDLCNYRPFKGLVDFTKRVVNV